jgi:hypothetical protein
MISFFLALSMAWASGEGKIVGLYKADVDVNEKVATIEFRLSHKFMAKYDNKEFVGTWTNKGNKIHLKSNHGICDYEYGDDLESHGGTQSGPGLTCKHTAKLEFCACHMYKD